MFIVFIVHTRAHQAEDNDETGGNWWWAFAYYYVEWMGGGCVYLLVSLVFLFSLF